MRRSGSAILLSAVIALRYQATGDPVAVREDFSTHRADLWQLSSGVAGTAAMSEGHLVLDLSKAQKGKWAYAQLHLALGLPARIEWDQCPAHDSRYTWFCGASLSASSEGEALSAGLGGGGMGNCVFLGSDRAAHGQVKEGQWYHLTLEVHADHQVLTVSPRNSGEPLACLESWIGLTERPFLLGFFQNDNRLGPGFPDPYDQDRGTTWIDNLQVFAAKAERRKPAEPVVTYPYRVPVVFNLAMRWLTRADGLTSGFIAYDAAGWLALTGTEGTSRWLQLEAWRQLDPARWPEQPNVQPVDNETTNFVLPERNDDATFALRAFQFNTEQHPQLEWQASPRGVEWNVEVTATDGVRPFLWRLWRSTWSAKGETGSLDLASVYHRSGRPNRYAEVDFLVRVRRLQSEIGNSRSLRLRLGMRGRVAIVPREPVVVTAQLAQERGVSVEALVVDSEGHLVADSSVKLEAQMAGRRATLGPVGSRGVRRGMVRGLTAGDYVARLTARDSKGRVLATTALPVAITPLSFANHYDREKRSYCTEKGEALGPLLGDLFAWVPYVDLGSDRQQMVLGLAQYRQLVEQERREFAWVKWRSLPRADIAAYLNYMAASGVRVLRLTPNVHPAEYFLDAGGHVAPHGVEQISYILAAARRHGLRVVINLFHYPYLSPSTGNNPPVWQLLELGYPSKMTWTSDEMWGCLSRYLDEVLSFTSEDPAVMAYTINGENDQSFPAAWVNRAYDFIKARAPRQMVVLEQGGSLFDCRDGDPSAYGDFRPAVDGGVGYRDYATYQYPNDCFMAVAARFYDLAPPSFLGEVACGINTQPGFVTKYRDAMGLALTLQQTMALAWSATMVEEQCKAFTEAVRLVDWTSFRRAHPPVAVIVDKPDKEQVKRMVQIEEALASVPVDYEYARPMARGLGHATVLDARSGGIEPSLGKALSEATLKQIPIGMPPGNHCSYALSADHHWMVAYVRNATHYELGLCDLRSVEKYRLADRERDLSLELRGFPGKSRYRMWDAASAAVLRQGGFTGNVRIDLGRTPLDVVVLVAPRI